MLDFPPGTPWIYAWLGAAGFLGLVIGWLLGRWGKGSLKKDRARFREELDEALEDRRSAQEAMNESGELAAVLQRDLDETRASLSDADVEIERLRTDLDAAETRIVQLETEAGALDRGAGEEADRLRAALSKAHEEVDDLRAALSAATMDTDARVSAADSEAQEAIARAAALEEALSAARVERDRLHEQIADLHEGGGADGAEAALREQLAAARADADDAAERLQAAAAEIDALRAAADAGGAAGALEARDHLVRELQAKVAALGGVDDRLKAREAELGELRRSQAAVVAARDAEIRTLRERVEILEIAPAPHSGDGEAAAALRAELAAANARLAEAEARIAEAGPPAAPPEATPAAVPAGGPAPIGADIEQRLDRLQDLLADKEARIAYLADRVARLESNLGGPVRSSAVPPAAPAAPAEAPAGPAAQAGDRAPDDLTEIWGIGPAIARKLNSVGVTTFEHVAALGSDDRDRLGDLLGVFLDRIDADDWVGQARRLVEERGGTVPSGPLAPIRLAPPAPSRPDDLTLIKGIGPYIAGTLNELGVTTFAQIAAWSPREVDEIGEALVIFKDRITREGWVEQARRLMRRG